MPSASKLPFHNFFSSSFYTLGSLPILHDGKDPSLSFPMRAATDATSRSLPRLSSLLEENTSSETATNVVAVLPASLTHGAGRRCCTYVAVATYPSIPSALADSERDHGSSRGPLSMEDLLGSTSLPQAQMQQRPYSNSRGAPAISTLGVSRPGGQPVLQLCMYTLTMPGQQPSSSHPADIAPDMMLVQTVDLHREDVRTSATLMQAAGGASEQEDAAQKDSIPLIVEQVAWVGLEYVAVKTQPHRRLLLLRSGLTSSAASSSSSSGNNSFSTLNAGEGALRPRPLCRVFDRVGDFSAVTLRSGSAVLFVAGMRHVTAVVSYPQEPLKGNNGKALQEHTWNIGPFTCISSAASQSSDAGSDIYFCGAAANHSVEVYRWTLHAATPPVCVHHVLTSPGSFSYSIAASSLDATRTDAAQVDFWVLAAERGDRESEERRGQGTNTNGSAESPAAARETLPLLRGVDGRFFQVESAATQSAQSLRRRPLNAVWHGNTPAGTKASIEGAATDQQEHFNGASLAQLDSLVSLPIGAPRFLPTGGSPTAASEMSSTLQRYVLHLHLRNCEEARQPAQSSDTARTLCGWQSEMLSMETAECAAALRWLAEGRKASERTAHRLSPPQWRLNPLVLARPAGSTSVGGERSASAGPLTHELLLHTSHRLLTLSVKSTCNLSSPSPASVLEACGTRALAAPERIVGLCPLTHSFSASNSLLMLHGKSHTVDEKSDEEKEKREKLTVYGQKFVVPSWTAVADICATLVQSLKPWVNVAAPVIDRGAAREGREELLAAVRSAVAAEGERVRRHMDARLDRIEALLAQLVGGKKTVLTD